VGDVSALAAEGPGPVGLVREALGALGVASGVSVVTQVRVPDSSGLGGDTALAVALVAAVAASIGRTLGPAEIARLAGEVLERARGEAVPRPDVVAAVQGGCVFEDGDRGASDLAVDPAALEECLLLVEAASPGAVGATVGPNGHQPESEGLGASVLAAVRERRFSDLAAALRADWTARTASPGFLTEARERVASALLPCGAGLRACGSGRGSVVLVVAPPGARGPGVREAALAAAKAASLRLFKARVDLLGLDVWDVPAASGAR
jgi:hypothetical protein